MFGKPSQSNGSVPPSTHPDAATLATIEGGGLVQLIVSELHPLTFFLFLNEKAVPEMDVESLSIDIETPTAANGNTTVVRATLARYVNGVTGTRSQQRQELFPCTLEIIALGKRISITAMNADSTEGLWISLGLKPDGESNELHGLSTFRFLLNEGLLDAKISWEDGTTEDLLPQ